jgi:hypothetical protein
MAAIHPERDTGACVGPHNGGLGMEPHQDRERHIGAGILLGLAAFVLVALVSFYFEKPPPEHTSSIRDNIASTAR